MRVFKIFTKFAILLQLFVVSWIISSPSVGATFLMTPIETITLQGDTVSASYDLPCGAEPVGALVRTNAVQNTMRLAMVVRVNKIICTALPKRTEESLDYISTKGFIKVEPLAIGDPIRIAPVAVQGLRIGSKETQVEAVFESNCGKMAGTILRRGSDDTVEVAMAEVMGASSVASTGVKKCTAGTVTATVPGALMTEGRKFRPYDVTPQDIERAFFVRLAEVKDGSLERRTNGVSVSFLRKCNEAPIGVVVDGKSSGGKLPRSIDVSQVRIGVLVARYYNLVCAEGSPRMVEDRISNNDLSIPQTTQVKFMAQTTKSSTLTITEPSQYALMKKGSGRGLVIDYKTGCNKQVGAVFARDDKGNLAVAVVERQGDPFSCKAGRDRSLIQPFAGKGPGAVAVYPLKIRRSSDRAL